MSGTADWPLWARIQQHTGDAPDRVAYIEQGTGRSITYGALVDAVIAAPQRASAVEVLSVGNRIAFVVRLLALLRAGGSVLPIDVTVPAAESDRLTQIAIAAKLDAPAVLLPSSGTTGQPKLICRPRDGLHGMASGLATAIGLTSADRVLAAVPLAHSYGLEHGLLIPLWAGCTVLLCDGLDFPPMAAAWRAGPTVFPAVPSMLELLLRSELPKNESLRRVYTAGAPLPASVAGAFEDRYGVPVGQVYGMTEIGSVTYRDPARDAADSVGRAVADVQMRIDDVGELLVRSPSMLSGYFGDASASAALVDGFFRTSDLAELSADGEVTLLGRTKLLIDVGGAKVNPLEVESILGEHPGVAACVVLPLALSETIRKVRAIVVPTDPAAPPSATELREFVRQRLARHKVPRLIEFRESLPRTPAGKIARQLLETM
ncbi:MAG: putative fatty-acid--CoA ligase [Phycisphaerales bacterium]|nr:putative fatty-acid--CoA ligase [Phycisphaerales bacterium]